MGLTWCRPPRFGAALGFTVRFAKPQPASALADAKERGLRRFAELGAHPATFPRGRDLEPRRRRGRGSEGSPVLAQRGDATRGVDEGSGVLGSGVRGAARAALPCPPKPAVSVAGVRELPRRGRGLLEKGRCGGEGDKT